MEKLIKETLSIIHKSGSKIKPAFLLSMLLGTVLESLSVGLIVPVIIILSKGVNIYTKPTFIFFTQITGSNNYWEFLIVALLLIVLFYLFKTFFITFVNKQHNKFIFSLEVEISEKLLRLYLNQPYPVYLKTNSAQLTKNVYFEVKQLSNTISQALTLTSEILVITLLGGILLIFQPQITIAVIFFVGIMIFLFIRYVRKQIKSWAADRLKNDGDRVKIISDAFNNIKDVKLYGRQNYFNNKYQHKSDLSVYASMKYANFLKLPSVWLEFIAVFSLISLIGIMLFRNYSWASIIPSLGLFAAVMFRVLPSLNRISSAYQTIRFYTPVIHTVYNELNLLKETGIEGSVGGEAIIFSSNIKLKNISFNYEDSPNFIFKNLSLTIIKGAYVGLIGHSGSGKSTLVDIIIGLLTPIEGKVEIDGGNIFNNLRSWQDQIGYVSQTINLTDDTIGNNIAFGIANEHIDKNLLSKAIDDAQLADFINSLPAGINTPVGEKGVRLSGGQRQRIGIARALYHNPTVLVFDEATNALDTKTEAELMKSIKLLKTKKTIIFITHKNALLKDCDIVYEVEDGKLVIGY